MKKVKDNTNMKVKVEETSDECNIAIINKLYNERYKKFSCYCCLVIDIPKRLETSKRLGFHKFPQIGLTYGFKFTLTTCTISTYENLVWANLLDFYDLIFKTFKIIEHSFDTYP